MTPKAIQIHKMHGCYDQNVNGSRLGRSFSPKLVTIFPEHLEANNTKGRAECEHGQTATVEDIKTKHGLQFEGNCINTKCRWNSNYQSRK